MMQRVGGGLAGALVAALWGIACEPAAQDASRTEAAAPEPEVQESAEVTSRPLGEPPPAPEALPRLLGSYPADGDEYASFEPFFYLYFDGPVDPAVAQGRLTVLLSHPSDPEHIGPVYVELSSCPGDSACVVGQFPWPEHWESNRYEIRLRGASAAFDARSDGDELILAYRVLPYDGDFRYVNLNFAFDRGGIAYDPVRQMVIACGIGCHQGSITIVAVSPEGDYPGTVEVIGELTLEGDEYRTCDSLDLVDGELYLTSTWSSHLYRVADTTGVTLGPPEIVHETTLAPPHDALYQARSTAVLDGWLYVGGDNQSGTHYDDIGVMSAILRRDASGSWEVWQDFQDAINVGEGVSLASGHDEDGEYLYVAADADRTIYKISASTRAIVNAHPMPGLHDAQLRTDALGRLYVGTEADGLRVFRTDGSNGFTEVAPHLPFEAGRFALQEEGELVHVFLIPMNSDPRIAKATIRPER